ncbi:hypothetical protein SARC_11024 [Sphaeroforma arctica JP610]|uniref:Uncharacterized protein n=1 Tax=Sphaeroforma arctica JP610 TaxID=667725 RepID=A0A0L0FI64_9EUKA|nr:hypothetical protein SARC_11024 [Sphaeroforma arctica JP610]KNC76477.1 hypothetical protein SARC_11024 [Sphaeroforma arctica JP610]|eukprot:XP_014150379.1 hypothetical protein SARC_11024 [Sphaeroforma arctica JP610]
MTKAAKIPSAIDGASKKHTTEQSSKHSSTDKDGLRNRKKNETTTISSEVATETNDSSTKIDKHAKGTGKSGNNTKKKLEAKPSSWTWSGLIGTITGYVATLAAIAYIGVMGYHFFHLFHPEGAGPEDVGREYYNSFKDGEALDVYTYLTTGHRVCSGFIDNATESLNASTCVLVWNPKNIRYGYHNETMKQDLRYGYNETIDR